MPDGSTDDGRTDDSTTGEPYAQMWSAHEDLTTTNGELREALEELAAMHEALQGRNERLHALNRALQERCLQVDQVNAFLSSVVVGLQAAVVVVDRDLVVRVWNDAAEHLLRVSAEDADGRPLLELDTGLPAQQLGAALQRALSGEREVVTVRVDTRLPTGASLTCQVHVSPLWAGDTTFGALLLVQQDDCEPDS